MLEGLLCFLSTQTVTPECLFFFRCLTTELGGQVKYFDVFSSTSFHFEYLDFHKLNSKMYEYSCVNCMFIGKKYIQICLIILIEKIVNTDSSSSLLFSSSHNNIINSNINTCHSNLFKHITTVLFYSIFNLAPSLSK